MGLCGFPLWHFSVGALVAEELFNVKSRRVAKAATLRLPEEKMLVAVFVGADVPTMITGLIKAGRSRGF